MWCGDVTDGEVVGVEEEEEEEEEVEEELVILRC